MNDSSTGGYLLPEGAAPAEDADLDSILQQLIVGITGLSGSLVRPRWQAVLPQQPEATVNWCAIGVTRMVRDANPSIVYPADSVADANGVQVGALNADGVLVPLNTLNSSAIYYRHVELYILASFYGPNSMSYAELAADSIRIPQNLEAIKAFNLGFVDVGELVAAPELVNQTWIRRYDLPIHLRRQVVRTYPILNILSVDTVEINSDI